MDVAIEMFSSKEELHDAITKLIKKSRQAKTEKERRAFLNAGLRLLKSYDDDSIIKEPKRKQKEYIFREDKKQIPKIPSKFVLRNEFNQTIDMDHIVQFIDTALKTEKVTICINTLTNMINDAYSELSKTTSKFVGRYLKRIGILRNRKIVTKDSGGNNKPGVYYDIYRKDVDKVVKGGEINEIS